MCFISKITAQLQKTSRNIKKTLARSYLASDFCHFLCCFISDFKPLYRTIAPVTTKKSPMPMNTILVASFNHGSTSKITISTTKIPENITSIPAKEILIFAHLLAHCNARAHEIQLSKQRIKKRCEKIFPHRFLCLHRNCCEKFLV